MESILVTGGAGFIGSNITERLLSCGYRVVVLDNLSTGKMGNIEESLKNNNFIFYRGSILNSELLQTIIKKHDISLISHQAAIPSVEKSIREPVKTIKANIVGTTNLFNIAAGCCCKRIVFASSSSVYGDTLQLPKEETMSLHPKSPYAASKVAKEIFARVFSDLYGIEIVGLRYFNVYGRRQDPASEYAAVVPKFIMRGLRNEVIPIEGDGLQTRDFTYIDDVIQANLKALTQENILSTIFNIGYGERISILDLAKMILEITRSSSEINYKPPRHGDVRDSFADIESARKYLGYIPEFNIKKGLNETIAWFIRRNFKAVKKIIH
jgi:nucleoside-diphosphate-sugar epimerase